MERNFSERAYFLIDTEGRVRWKHTEASLGQKRGNEELLEQIARISE